MKTQFPEIELNKLAKYYERGEGIKGEFIESWNETEKICNDLVTINPKQYFVEKETIVLIQEMRKYQLNESLRIGTRLSYLILSRARKHIMDENTPYISIYFLDNNQMTVYSNLNNEEKNRTCELKYEGYLEKMVAKLLKETIK